MLPFIQLTKSLVALSLLHLAEGEHDFWRPLHQEIFLIRYLGDGGHVFLLGREWLLLQHLSLLANLLIILALRLEPQEESRLGRIADSLVFV